MRARAIIIDVMLDDLDIVSDRSRAARTRELTPKRAKSIAMITSVTMNAIAVTAAPRKAPTTPGMRAKRNASCTISVC